MDLSAGAMDLTTGAMGSLLGKLGELLKEEYDLQTSVKEDVKYLERELESMHAALRKVGDVPRDQLDEQVKIWANEVRDMSYRMEDIVDKFLVRVEGTKPAVNPNKLKRLMKKMGDLFSKGKTRHEIGDEIKAIKARVEEVSSRRDRCKVDDVTASQSGGTTIDPRLLALYKDRKEFVGIDGALNELTKMLANLDGDVVSICGVGGLGKTTLAKAVYDKLQAKFQCTAFVSVGRNPSAKKLLMDILFGINNKMSENSNLLMVNETWLINKLRELLENKRYHPTIQFHVHQLNDFFLSNLAKK